MRAAAIAEEIFRDNPDHPGAAHYLIHSYDDPIHASLGLRAARAYSGIAPDAAHAQHMTTHIFVAMGMWDDVISQNKIASDLTDWGPGHYSSWHHYGLLQQGRFAAPTTQLAQARSLPANRPPVQRLAYLASMRAHQVINTQAWDDPSLAWEIDLSRAGPVAQATEAFVMGFAAARRGDRTAATAQLARFEAWEGDPTLTTVHIMAKELESVVALGEGAPDRAAALLREATTLEDAMPFEFGPPMVVKPSHELFGEMLLELNRPAEAERQFTRALELAPQRALSLLGWGRAAAAAGNRVAASRAYELLRDIWHSADPGLPGLDEARRFVAAK
jgi:tetratricopeptide (TPR) repeat protein